MIIVGGRNLYPQDIEYTVERASRAVRKGSVAAFSVEGEDGEALVVVAEIERGSLEGDHQATVDAIVGDIAANHEVGVAAVEFDPAGRDSQDLQRQIQRRAARREFIEGRFDAVFSWSPSRAGGAASLQAADEGEAARLHDLLTQWFLENGELETTHVDIDRPLAVYGVDSVTAGSLGLRRNAHRRAGAGELPLGIPDDSRHRPLHPPAAWAAVGLRRARLPRVHLSRVATELPPAAQCTPSASV